MRNQLLMAAALVLVTAAAARAQDPPTLAARTDPVEIARSEFSGKIYGSLDFGGRINQVDGDEARFQRYRDLRGGLYATNLLIDGGPQTGPSKHKPGTPAIAIRSTRSISSASAASRPPSCGIRSRSSSAATPARSIHKQLTACSASRMRSSRKSRAARRRSGASRIRRSASICARSEKSAKRMCDSRSISRASIILRVRNTTRQGAIPFGGTFGFNNAVELPVPVDTRHTELQSAFEWGNDTGMLRVGWDGSTFDNNVESVTWDNPLRYGPDVAATPSQGRMALWPGNTLTYLHGTGAVSFPGRGRLTGYAAIGQGRSNENLLPFTINTAIPPVALSRSTAEAENRMTIAQFTVAMRPTRVVSLNAKYRYADVDVRTPIFTRPGGTVAYDSSFNASAGPSEYHSVQRSPSTRTAPFSSCRRHRSKSGSAIWRPTTPTGFGRRPQKTRSASRSTRPAIRW